MSNGLWPSLCQAGLAANRPAGVSEFPVNTFCFYYATDTNVLSVYNPATASWSNGGSTVSNAIAATGSTQGDAFPIVSKKNVVATAVTGATRGVKLPAASSLPDGYELLLVNNGAFPITVYPAVGDVIDAGLANTGATLTNAKACVFTLTTQGATGAWTSGPQGGHTA